MYSDLKNIQILIALLKKYNIRHIVLSPGGRNVPFVHSVEQDSYFQCYSIVDERSAAFFALGMIQYLKEPVAICCTSATAVCNYMSAVNEAFYQQLPLVVLTADRNHYYLNQDEDQMIPQQNIFKNVCKREVSLPIVRDKDDEWFCSRLVNEALSELEHYTSGPVHINFEVESIGAGYNVQSLPQIDRIYRIRLSEEEKWEPVKKYLHGKRILLIFGQHLSVTRKVEALLDCFTEKYNCVIAADHLSNIHCHKQINTFIISNTLAFESLNELLPDVVISMGGNYVSGIRNWLKMHEGDFVHWKISPNGDFADQFRNLKIVFECNDEQFLNKMLDENICENNGYFDEWDFHQKDIVIPQVDFSSFYVTQKFTSMLPENANLHLANSNSVRLVQLFDLKQSINVFCNRGCNGIDGSLSTFIGLANVSKELCFLMIGDLSFFYDMNGLWNHYIGKNIRILMNNNSGGGIFHVSPGRKLLPTINDYTAAGHDTKAKEWVEARGFKYLSARNKEEFDENIECFCNSTIERPIFFEVFTNIEKDAEVLTSFYNESKKKNLLNGKKSVLMKVAMRQLIK